MLSDPPSGRERAGGEGLFSYICKSTLPDSLIHWSDWCLCKSESTALTHDPFTSSSWYLLHHQTPPGLIETFSLSVHPLSTTSTWAPQLHPPLLKYNGTHIPHLMCTLHDICFHFKYLFIRVSPDWTETIKNVGSQKISNYFFEPHLTRTCGHVWGMSSSGSHYHTFGNFILKNYHNHN